ncbi:MAG: hypothetical protein AB1453_05190 [Chloroflexota bacterium]|jgi:DNA-binding NarL/FixJ family response regulator
MNRILLADPNPALRSALALLIETRLDAQIVGQVSSLESLLREAAATDPGVIIVSLNLLGEPTQERIAALRRQAPLASILISSARPESVSRTDGAAAFLCQADPPQTILDTLQTLFHRKSQERNNHV